MKLPIKNINKYKSSKYPKGISQYWGENPQVYKRFGLRGHNGIDIPVSNGTPVYAPHDGKVLESYYNKNGYGRYLKIESKKEGSVLAHLQKSVVRIGDIVKEGQLVAFSNNTGFSTGSHLHWGYYKIPRNRNDGYLGYINQLPLLKGGSMSNIYKTLDLENKESMKAVVDLWFDVVKKNKYIKRTTYEKILSENEKLKVIESNYNALIESLAKSLNVKADPIIIQAEIEKLKSVEDQKRASEKRVDEIDEKEAQEAKKNERTSHNHPKWIYSLGLANKIA